MATRNTGRGFGHMSVRNAYSRFCCIDEEIKTNRRKRRIMSKSKLKARLMEDLHGRKE